MEPRRPRLVSRRLRLGLDGGQVFHLGLSPRSHPCVSASHPILVEPARSTPSVDHSNAGKLRAVAPETGVPFHSLPTIQTHGISLYFIRLSLQNTSLYTAIHV